MNSIKLIPFLGLLFLLPACQKEQQQDASASNIKEGELPTNRIEIPVTVRNNLGITFAKVERRNLENTVRAPGSFELQPLAKHEYRMMLSGHVELLVDQFAEVEVGTPIYRFRSLKFIEFQQRVDLAKASLRKAETQYTTALSRKKALANANFKRADLEAQIAELAAEIEQQKTELSAANRALQSASELSGDKLPNNDENPSSWIIVKAKQPGVVQTLAITNGAFVEETNLILTTINPDKVRFHAMALQSDLLKFRNGQMVRIVPAQAKGADLNQSIEAVLQLGLTADPMQRTVPLFATPNETKSWVRPGISAFLEIATESTSGVVLAIPRSAVVKDGITHVFFKRDPLNPNKAIRVEADLGVNDGRWIEIKSELGPNDEVVLDGVYELKLASSQSGTSQKGGHFHADGSYHGEDH